MNLTAFIGVVIFFICLYYYTKPYKDGFKSGSANAGKNRCPNMLIQKDSKFYLYNSNLAKVPGVNPVEFDNLEDYTEFLEWQKSQGVHCPVLFLQQTYDAQGEAVYKARPSVSEQQGGLNPLSSVSGQSTKLIDASRNDPPYNQGSVAGYDESSFYVGMKTPLDEMNNTKGGKSADPMNPNWGGPEYTQSLVDAGVYKGNEVSINV
jgi:hypothetical protein